MKEIVEKFARILAKEIRDPAVRNMISVMQLPGPCCLSKLKTPVTAEVASALSQRLAIIGVDSGIEWFLFIIDQLITRGEIQVMLKSAEGDEKWVELDYKIPMQQLYAEWIRLYSTIPDQKEFARLMASPK